TVPLTRLQAPCTTPVIPTPTTGTPPTVRTWPGSGITASVSNGPGDFLISARTAQRLTCDCTIHRLVLDPAGMPLDVGRSTRTIPKQIRIALNQRDQGCAYPGCERPPGWCAAHHIQHWAHGGETSLQNLVLLCDRHHHKIHDTNHTITTEPGRKPVITKPRW
ncbi:MAG: HNH endonuclease, partial [Actinomycetes bacterium]